MKDYKHWGKSTSINLCDCDLTLISDPEAIKQFVKKLVKVVDMVAHGPCYIDRFGVGSLEGISAMQFIETSSITVHCDEPGRRVFVDLFSCKDYDAVKARKFSKEFFKAKKVETRTLIR